MEALNLLWWLWPPLATLFAIWSGVFCYRSHKYLRSVQAEDRRRAAEAATANNRPACHSSTMADGGGA